MLTHRTPSVLHWDRAISGNDCSLCASSCVIPKDVIPMREQRTYYMFVLLLLVIAAAARGADNTSETLQWNSSGVHVRLDPAVVVATSPPGEKRWGRFQFVSISEYPGGRILLRHHDAADAVKAYGTPSPTYISADSGKTWEAFNDEGLPPSGLTCRLLDGNFLCMPMAKPLEVNAASLKLPAPIGESFSYGRWTSYLVEQCPEPVVDFFRNYDAVRWEPGAAPWRPEKVTYETSGAIMRAPHTTTGTRLLSRTSFERPPLAIGRELLFADYRTNFVQDDGFVPQTWGISCMVSQDNGKSWHRRSTIALDRQTSDNLTEPVLAQNSNGELVCVIRRADHRQKSMLITYSNDQGRTWDKPRATDELGDFGVFPSLSLLDCGVMVMAYGRPGVLLSLSTDGTGRTWSAPYTLLRGDANAILKHTDGYTSMLPMGKNKLLFAYTDFDHRDAEGNQRKAILVRTLTVE